jgi:hypothetical protein
MWASVVPFLRANRGFWLSNQLRASSGSQPPSGTSLAQRAIYVNREFLQ